VVALLAARQLLRAAPTPAIRAAVAVFAGSATLMLTMSGIYHATELGGTARDVMQRLDHAAIWLLIAGTFTPVHVIMFRGAAQWGMLAFIWACAAVGIVLKTVFFASVPDGVGFGLYLGLGWMGIVSAVMLARAYGFRAVRPMLLGGLLYSVGAAAPLIEAPVLVPGYLGPHELFHLAVLAALVVHWRFVANLPGLRAGSQAPGRLLPGAILAGT
jgi:channel protein (hemolysin III family)